MSRCADSLKTEVRSNDSRNHAASTEAEPALRSVYLHPGEMYASLEPANLTIILGSCVAVCLFDERLSIGGATHYLLPALEGEGQTSPRYGDTAIKKLLQELHQLGSRNRDLRAHVYGGACMLQAFRGGSNELIGDKNVRMALQILSRESIPVVKQETGGDKSRKVTMRSDTGVTSIKLIGN